MKYCIQIRTGKKLKFKSDGYWFDVYDHGRHLHMLPKDEFEQYYQEI